MARGKKSVRLPRHDEGGRNASGILLRAGAGRVRIESRNGGVMEWEPFVEEGVIVPAEGTEGQAMPRVNEGWDAIIRARARYSECRYTAANEELRNAMAIAGEGLCLYYGYRLTQPTSVETSEYICTSFFKKNIAEAVFERGRILEGMLPLPEEPLDDDVALRVRHSIGAGAELCAMVESFVYF